MHIILFSFKIILFSVIYELADRWVLSKIFNAVSMPDTYKSSWSLELHRKILINVQILGFSPNNPHPGYLCQAYYSVLFISVQSGWWWYGLELYLLQIESFPGPQWHILPPWQRYQKKMLQMRYQTEVFFFVINSRVTPIWRGRWSGGSAFSSLHLWNSRLTDTKMKLFCQPPGGSETAEDMQLRISL